LFENDVAPLEHRIFPLSQVNDAMAASNDRNAGFTSFVVDPRWAGPPGRHRASAIRRRIWQIVF
jgi:hypothetical protein